MSSMPAATPATHTPCATHVPLAEVTRGTTVESVHAGSVAVVDAEGHLLFAAGAPESLTFARSALKPLQALPFAAAGGIERFGYTPPEVALLCASHGGEPMHVEAVARMLAKAGNTMDELQCGTHAPSWYEANDKVPPQPPYSPLAHNCSGKHSGMLAHCTACGYAKHDYLDFAHPLQQEIRRAVAQFTDVREAELVAATDGCSAPNYAVPLRNLALAFARLATATVDGAYGTAPRRLADAMTAHPEMVSGQGRSDLALMTAGRGDWVTKIGAEGVQAIGVRSRGWGIAVKVADGNRRGLHPATVATLEQLGLLDGTARAALAQLGRPPVRNYRGTVTGEVRPVVVLDKFDRRSSMPSSASPQ